MGILSVLKNKGSKTQNTTSNTAGATTGFESSTASTTPNVPAWLLDPAQGIAGGIRGLQERGPGEFRPGVSDLQRQAWDAASGMPITPGYTGARGVLQNMQDVNVGDVRARDVTASNVAASKVAAGKVAAGNVAAGNVSGESVLSGLSNYYNPFKDQVLNPVLNDYDFQSGQTRASQAASAARNKAFQGSRFGVQEGETEGALARGRAATQGGLLTDMYGQAVGMSEADTGRRQQAGLANQEAQLRASLANQDAGLRADLANQDTGLRADLANQDTGLRADLANQDTGLRSGLANQDATLRADLANQGMQFTSGDANRKAAFDRARLGSDLTDRSMENTRLNLGLLGGFGADATGAMNAAKQYDIDFQKQMGGLLQGVDPSQFIGKTIDSSGMTSGTTTENMTGTGKVSEQGGLLETGGKIAKIAALFSDRRTKRDIRTLGHDDRGRRWVSFDYLWSPGERQVGVIAQELLHTDPEAVSIGPSGLYMVDYGRLADGLSG